MNRRISTLNIKILNLISGGVCSIRACRQPLILYDKAGVPVSHIGKIAHISAYSPSGSRGDVNIPREQISEYDNLILLCPTCHDTVDAVPDQYPIEYLKEEKRIHELWFKERLYKYIPQVCSPELIIASQAIATGDYYSSDDLNIVPTIDKIVKNNFTNKVITLIDMGLNRSGEVKRFFKAQQQVDKHFVRRLTHSFKTEYYKQKHTCSDDELFFSMLTYARFGNKDMIVNASSLVILSYLFQICEVFEK